MDKNEGVLTEQNRHVQINLPNDQRFQVYFSIFR